MLVSRITEVFDVEKLPALSDRERDAARQALKVYEDMPATSSPRMINRLMTTMSVAFPNQRLSDDEADLRIEVYTQALSDIAPDLLAAGIKDVVRTCTFFPSVAEIRAAAMRQPMGPHRWRAYVLRQLLRKPQPEPIGAVDPAAAAKAAAAVKRLALPATKPAGVEAYIKMGLSHEEAADAVKQHRLAMQRAADDDRRAGEARLAARKGVQESEFDPPG